jgi:hypothetical protein
MQQVAESLPRLDSPLNAKLRLEVIQNSVMSGVLSGAEAGAAVRACEVWLKADAHETDRNRVRSLEKKLDELEKELATARRGGPRVG